MSEPSSHRDDHSTVHRPRSWLPGETPSFTVTVVEGPDNGRRFVLEPEDPGRQLVGTSHICPIRLSDREVSRRHAAFEFAGPDLHLTDLESTNGTVVNGLSIVEVVVRGGETIRVGSTTLVLEPRKKGVQPAMSDATAFGRVVGASPAMRRLYPLCEKLTTSEVSVLIEGETGTGKELLAEAIHERGPRAAGPFVVFDCAAVAHNLIESHLFGHERGAFTGATATRRGVFELAHTGTLFIDEIGDLDLALQAKLLRAIERGEVGRVGSERWVRVDVRILAATRRDLDREVQSGRFRDDLFFRLAIARVELPPLRRRHGDIGLLARHFWQTLGGGGQPIPYELFESFEEAPWPGNVRELKNTIARRLALGELDISEAGGGSVDRSADDGDFLDEIMQLDLPLPRARQRVVAEFEKRYVERVLAIHDGDVAKAVAASGIARRYFNLLRARHRGE